MSRSENELEGVETGEPPVAVDENDIAPRQRRRRRREADIRTLIIDAARAEFSLNGYAATTTRAIATRADVSESLLFRYFGPKSGLYEAVALAPLDELMARSYNPSVHSDTGAQYLVRVRTFVTELTTYLRENRVLLSALFQVSTPPGDGDEPPISPHLKSYFERAAETVSAQHERIVGYASPDVALAVRLSFGAVLAAALLPNWLFAEDEPPLETVIEGLVRYLVKGLAP